jgi:hypothetical protein
MASGSILVRRPHRCCRPRGSCWMPSPAPSASPRRRDGRRMIRRLHPSRCLRRRRQPRESTAVRLFLERLAVAAPQLGRPTARDRGRGTRAGRRDLRPNRQRYRCHRAGRPAKPDPQLEEIADQVPPKPGVPPGSVGAAAATTQPAEHRAQRVHSGGPDNSEQQQGSDPDRCDGRPAAASRADRLSLGAEEADDDAGREQPGQG